MRQLLAVCLLLAIGGVQAEGPPTRAELPPDPAKCAACAFINHRITGAVHVLRDQIGEPKESARKSQKAHTQRWADKAHGAELMSQIEEIAEFLCLS